MCQTAWKFFQFLQKERPSFSSKNCQFIDFYNTYFLNGLDKAALPKTLGNREVERLLAALVYDGPPALRTATSLS